MRLIKSKIKLFCTYFRAAALNELYLQNNAVNTNSTSPTSIDSTKPFPVNAPTQTFPNQDLPARNPYQQEYSTPYPVTNGVPSINNREGYEVYEAGQGTGYVGQEPGYHDVSKYSK